QDPAEGLLADRHGDRGPRVHGLHAADHPVRRLHRDAPHDVLTELLGHFGNDVDLAAALLALVLDADRVVDGRKFPRRELDVEDRPDDRDDLADVLLRHVLRPYSSAAAPETISMSSLVMRACRARL